VPLRVSVAVTNKARPAPLRIRPRDLHPDRCVSRHRMINNPLTLPLKLNRRANGIFQSFR
jgi:hypothetical protein